MKALLNTDHFGLAKAFPRTQGKVRDIFRLGDGRLAIVTTDRVSAFDHVLPNPIPGRGIILTRMTINWLEELKKTIKSLTTNLPIRHHVLSTSVSDLPNQFHAFQEDLAGRLMIVEECDPIPVEFILRGNITGSWWKEYRALIAKDNSSTVILHGHELPRDLQESQEFPEALFTPSTKAAVGVHDENISVRQMVDIITDWLKGKNEWRSKAIPIVDDSIKLTKALFNTARERAKARGIIIADTKFELGLSLKQDDFSLVIIDEVLTSDSSRFWPLDEFIVGQGQASFDKQIIRNYLESIKWDKKPPIPSLPDEIVSRTSERYQEASTKLFEN
ncbi:phosphoribosylaminoimidazolesuccinocarboxamide synthase [Patescibacteria group bacterium]|nr:phosphoribosylaminoimidazolesuccinocarboxamide synthase [Patescibacteria group bacterium]